MTVEKINVYLFVEESVAFDDLTFLIRRIQDCQILAYEKIWVSDDVIICLGICYQLKSK